MRIFLDRRRSENDESNIEGIPDHLKMLWSFITQTITLTDEDDEFDAGSQTTQETRH